MKKKINFLLFILAFCKFTFSQNTLGLIYNSNNAYDGYTLFTPQLNNSVYLIDNCGNSINSWTFTSTPRLTCYLLENGNLLRAGADGIEIRNWDNAVVWSYNLLSELGIRQHHDIEPLPNGNILCLVKEGISETEQIALGKRPELLNGTFKSEKIIEIQPVGNNQINIIWEWRFVDHLIQDYDPQISNYGNVSLHPELVDFNYNEVGFDHSDWLHMNSIDYNEGLDQIILSSRTLGEIYIIDHSTTTIEAAGHIGGNQNKGGDFLWRWGNPQVYKQGSANDQKLFEQHDAKWITENYVNENKITVFNNNNSDGTDTFSSIHIVSPSLDENNSYQLQNNQFLPTNFYWSWNGNILGETFHEFNKSGTIALENGNMLLCETKKGRLTEVSPDGNIVWIYRNPIGSITHNQFDTDADIFNDNSLFRGEKYHKSYQAFIGKNLEPGPILENLNSLSENCNLLSTLDFNLENKLKFINPVSNNKIIFNQEIEKTDIIIYNTLGNKIFEIINFNGNILEVNSLKGIYFLKFSKKNKSLVKKIIFK